MRPQKHKLGSFEKIGKDIKYSTAHVCAVFNGKARPSLEMAEELEKYTGVPVMAWLKPSKYPNPYITQ